MIKEIAFSGLLSIVNSTLFQNISVAQELTSEEVESVNALEEVSESNTQNPSQNAAQGSNPYDFNQFLFYQEGIPDEVMGLYNLLMAHAEKRSPGFYNSSFKFTDDGNTYLVYACEHFIHGQGLLIHIYDSETNEYQIGLYDYNMARINLPIGLSIMDGSFDGYIEHIQSPDRLIVETDDLNYTILYRHAVDLALELLGE